MTGILLAGGKSRRMDKDKAFIDFQGKKLYEYPLSVLKKFCPEILISSSDKRFENTNFPVIPDITGDIGPLGGIYTCLRKAKNDKALILSCDIPFINPEFIKLLIINSRNQTISLGINKNKMPEPLMAVYDKKILNRIEDMIKRGDFKIRRLFKVGKIKYLDPLMFGFDPDKLFFNVNSPSDLKEAEKQKIIR